MDSKNLLQCNALIRMYAIMVISDSWTPQVLHGSTSLSLNGILVGPAVFYILLMHIKLKSLVTMQLPYNKRVGNVQTWCDSCASSSLARRLATKSRSRCHLSRRLLTWERISSLARCLLAISSSPTSYNSSHRGCRAFTSCSKA